MEQGISSKTPQNLNALALRQLKNICEKQIFYISLQPQIKTQPLTLDMDAGNVAQKLKIMDLIKIAEQAFATEVKNFPAFKAGDTITITYRIKEENKERLQKFRGVCIQRKGTGVTQTFTVRKISNGIGVERIFPLTSPFIENIELNKVGKVRRARIFYLRKLTGKKARIKEKKMALIVEENTAQE